MRLEDMVPEAFAFDGRTHRYQAPHAAAGVIVFLPRAMRTADGFWPWSTQAPRCTGLGEDVSHARQALARGYAFIAATRADDREPWSCANGDHEHLARMLSAFLEERSLQRKPVYLCGACDGGDMAVRLPGFLKTRADVHWAVAGVVAEAATDVLDAPDAPPHVWVVPQRAPAADHARAARHLAALRARGVPAAMVIAPARRVTPQYFAERVPHVTERMSQVVAGALTAIGLLDDTGNFTVHPGRALAEWTAHFRRVIPAAGYAGVLSFDESRSPLLQALLAAYAEREHMADHLTPALAWFESKCTSDFSTLVDTLAVRAV